MQTFLAPLIESMFISTSSSDTLIFIPTRKYFPYLLVAGSFITMTSASSPNAEKYSLIDSGLVCHDSPPINILPGSFGMSSPPLPPAPANEASATAPGAVGDSDVIVVAVVSSTVTASGVPGAASLDDEADDAEDEEFMKAAVVEGTVDVAAAAAATAVMLAAIASYLTT